MFPDLDIVDINHFVWPISPNIRFIEISGFDLLKSFPNVFVKVPKLCRTVGSTR